MGKVYEALKISGAYIDAQAARGGVGPAPKEPAAAVEPEAINYLDYLLNGIPVIDTAAETEGGELAPVQKPVIDVARQAIVDIGSVDHGLVANSSSDRSAVEQYNRLAVALISAGSQRALKRVVVGSAARGEGRTTVAVNLACRLARSRKRVLLVDGDLHRPSIMGGLGIISELGLGEIFNWRNPGSALLAVPGFGFDLLPTRSPVANSAEVLASRPFNVAIELLGSHYDYILFDTPPLLESADAHLLMRIADTMLMVIAAGELKTAQLAKAVEGLKPQDIFGVALNRAQGASRISKLVAAG
ncbi:MAG TPA: CpsD/CapB family tyrosine-protein kinase [Blastocatellia bacterium]|nr:CpsD/CapB family tyrosine-protein kinase [Blastocatellia bacterium]